MKRDKCMKSYQAPAETMKGATGSRGGGGGSHADEITTQNVKNVLISEGLEAETGQKT